MKSLDKLSLGMLGATSIITAALYPRLPARVPVHFDLRGVADAWMDKSVGAWLLLAVAVAVFALVRFGGALLPRGFRARFEASPVGIVGALVVSLFCALQLMILWSAMHTPSTIGRPFALVFGLFWIVLAQVLPRVRRNPFVGIRTTWTLTSDENWARTHRFAAWVFTLGGLVALLGAVVSPTLAFVAIGVSALVPVVYSYVLAHRLGA
jgi:uncharacterized membrane protein